jgi:hypothetical protein
VGVPDGQRDKPRLIRVEFRPRADTRSHGTGTAFEAPASSSDALASELADSLLSPGWYANWYSDIEATVVFPGKIFRYPRGDRAGREEAKAHSRSVGVPEPQLDWTD